MASAGPMQNFINWIVAKDMDEEEEVTTESRPTTTNTSTTMTTTRRSETPKLRAVRSEQTMEIYHPRSLDEREKIADSIKSRIYVTLDLTRLADSNVRKSFFDFICGVVYGLDANISSITDGVYAIMPFGMEINNDDTSADLVSSIERTQNPLTDASIFSSSDVNSWMGKRQ